ncbi:MAG: hypothetical protein DMG95_00100 [Acidobacteria bacterium]|nr:MAG: hypothetical protein DMG94_11890 [Acidobacteriota bacterium]PYV66011.1 MAG: hypothetical protein DMG95_00100 [Acidobacteriota bacterium]
MAVAVFPETLTAHGLVVPLQPPPLQPVKVYGMVGEAVSVTGLASGKSAVHVPGQLIPAGVLVTVPLPAPAVVTVS